MNRDSTLLYVDESPGIPRNHDGTPNANATSRSDHWRASDNCASNGDSAIGVKSVVAFSTAIERRLFPCAFIQAFFSASACGWRISGLLTFRNPAGTPDEN